MWTKLMYMYYLSEIQLEHNLTITQKIVGFLKAGFLGKES